MYVQISVTVWTILCFLVLMLVLDRLLFRPLLALMDKRREKIESAKTARETALQERAEELRKREEEHQTAKKQAMLDASAALEVTEQENARRIAEKKAENEQRLAQQRDELAKESQAILAEAESHAEELVAVIAGRIQVWPDAVTAAAQTKDAAPYSE